MSDIQYDIVVVGGSLGGVAAALRAGAMGANVCLIEATDWLGGQYTAQGVTKPDDNQYVDTVGSTAGYRAFRHAVRAYYRNNFRLSSTGASQPEFNPGGKYPGFALEPRVGSNVLNQMLTDSSTVHLRLDTQIENVEVSGDTIISVTATDAAGTTARYLAAYFLDATDLGDLLPLCGTEGVDWVLGAESQDATQEPAAPPAPRRDWIQPITVPFALEHRPAGENHTIPQPANYDQLKAQQSYTILDGYIKGMFTPGADMWSYRQFIASKNFADPAFPYDLTMINTGGNDYEQGTLPTGSVDGDAAVIAAARQASLGYLYWLQTECPRDDHPTRKGYPELKLRVDLFGTTDGTAAQPYIRESRRIKALKTIVQQDLDVGFNAGPRAKLFSDSCGIGHYGMDVHALTSAGMPNSFIDTMPYQIPVSALIPVRLTNLLAACKNLGVTHITNGAYRLHPIEWNIGESAGALAAFCVSNNVAPQNVPVTADLLSSYQHTLLDAGIPLFWWTDITTDNPIFAAIHMLGVNGIFSGYQDMTFRPNNLLSSSDRHFVEGAVGHSLDWPSSTLTRGQAALWLAQTLHL